METPTPINATIQWPANQRAALIVLVHIDAPPLDAGPELTSGGLDYTATGLHRLLTAFADIDIQVTTAWTSRALSTFPQLARSAQAQGHELALSQVEAGAETPGENTLTRISDTPVAGIVQALPIGGTTSIVAAPPDVPLLPSLAWTINGLGGDVPIRTIAGEDHGALTVIPVSPYWIDLPWLDPQRPLPPSSLLEAWSLSLAAVRTEGGLMTIVIHPQVAGRPGLAGIVTRFIDEAIESGDVWIATAAQVAEWWQRQSGDEPT
jgi:hypothetical protein